MKLEEYKKYFSIAFDEFVWLNDIPADKIVKELRYEKIPDVTRVHRADNEAFFFKEGKLKIIYISNDILTGELWRELQLAGKEPEKTVRSRAGKTSNQKVFATLGITISVSRDEVDFVEIYEPCTVEEYLETIYTEPGKFIR